MLRSHGRVRAAVLGAVLMAAGVVRAEDRLVTTLEGSLGARFSPLGIAAGTRVNLRWRPLSPRHPMRRNALGDGLFSATYVGVGAVVEASPAFVRGGVGVEFSPLAAWRVRANWQALQTFGLFDQYLRFPTNGRHDIFARQQRHHVPGQLTPRLVMRVTAESLLQFRVWRLLAFNLTNIEGWRVPEAGYYYNGEYDLLMNGGGELVFRNTFVGGVVVLDKPGTPELAIGPFWMFTRAMVSGWQNQQAGIAIVHSPIAPALQPRGASVIMLLGYHAQHPYRPAYPFMAMLISWALS